MSYLIFNDYKRLIQDTALQQVLSDYSTIRIMQENAGITEMKSYLSSKYDVSKEFTNTSLFDPSAKYTAGDRVYLDASSYLATSIYSKYALCLYSGYVYMANQDIATAEAFNSSHWDKLGYQYQIFYVSKPYDEFNLSTFYTVDSICYYLGHTYKCLIETIQYDHSSLIQYVNTNDIPYQNIFPTDTIKGSQYWKDLGVYQVDGKTIIDDNTTFIDGDNRNQQVVNYLIDIVIYNLYSRIPPQQVPQNRIDRFALAKEWLKAASKAIDISADIPKIQPPSGKRIRYGSSIKQINTY